MWARPPTPFTSLRPSGYTQFAGMPIAVRSTWPLTKGAYDRLPDEAWPTVGEYDEDVLGTSGVSPLSIDYDRAREASEKLAESLQELLAEEA